MKLSKTFYEMAEDARKDKRLGETYLAQHTLETAEAVLNRFDRMINEALKLPPLDPTECAQQLIDQCHAYEDRLAWVEKNGDAILERVPDVIGVTPGNPNSERIKFEVANTIAEGLYERLWDCIKSLGYTDEFIDMGGTVRAAAPEEILLERQVFPQRGELEDLGIHNYGVQEGLKGYYIFANLEEHYYPKAGLEKDAVKEKLRQLFPDAPLRFHWDAEEAKQVWERRKIWEDGIKKIKTAIEQKLATLKPEEREPFCKKLAADMQQNFPGMTIEWVPASGRKTTQPTPLLPG